jgi:chromosome segregation ATPase
VLETTSDDKDLPPYEELLPHFEFAYNELSILLKQEDQGNSEYTLFKERVAELQKSAPGDAKSLKEFEELQKEEHEITRVRDEVPNLKKELVEWKTKAEEEEKNSKDLIGKMNQENAKKVQGLQKELNTLKGNLEKLRKEFEKKSEARRAEIKKKQEAKAGGGA